MASIYDDIRQALEVQLNGITGIPDIAWENVDYSPTTGTSFVRPSFRPFTREPAVRGLNPQQRYTGAFFIDVFVDEGNGPASADTLANTLIESFDATSTLTANSINVCIRDAYREVGTRSGAWYMVRVVVNWYTYA